MQTMWVRLLIPAVLFSGCVYRITPRRSDAPLHFGTKNGSSFFSGQLDEIALFSRKLTAAEISQLYNSAKLP